MRFATLKTFTLSPLPCWKHLPEEKCRKLVGDLIAEIRRQRTGARFWGRPLSAGSIPSIV
jgi:hypothetical protein